MAKALLGHLGGPDPRLMAENVRLRRRVTDLTAEVLRLRAENDALAGLLDAAPVTLPDLASELDGTKQPALA